MVGLTHMIHTPTELTAFLVVFVVVVLLLSASYKQQQANRCQPVGETNRTKKQTKSMKQCLVNRTVKNMHVFASTVILQANVWLDQISPRQKASRRIKMQNMGKDIERQNKGKELQRQNEGKGLQTQGARLRRQNVGKGLRMRAKDSKDPIRARDSKDKVRARDSKRENWGHGTQKTK